jgi:hypothetical protein
LPFNDGRSDAQHKNAAKFHGRDYVKRTAVFDFNQFLCAAESGFIAATVFVIPVAAGSSPWNWEKAP